jgi:phage-related protein
MTGAQSALENEFSNIGGPVGQSMGQGMMGSLKSLAGPMAAIVGGVAIGNFTRDIVSAAQAEVEQNARINQIASSMGLFGENAGKVSQRLIDLAQAQALNKGLDEDSIKNTQAKLLTFKELAATAGDMGGMFDRATMAAMDLAAAGFGSAEGNAVALGKALNDPIQGMASLSRMGVQFTDEQKAMIEAMVTAGDMAGAQALMMKELETQVGGTAEATSTNADKMTQAFANFQETLGLLVLPAVEQLAIVGADLMNWMADNPVVVQALAIALGILAAAFVGVTIATWAMNTALLANPITWIIIGVMALIGALVLLALNWDSVFKWLTTVWAGFVGWITPGIKAIGDVFSTVFNGIGQVIGNVFNGVVWLVKSYINTILNLVNGVIGALNGVGSFISKATGGSIGFKLNKIPLLANGGTITGSGTVLVGEKGPELLNLNRGASVVPLDKASGQTIVYNAAPNTSLDAEQALFTAMRRAKVVGW